MRYVLEVGHVALIRLPLQISIPTCGTTGGNPPKLKTAYDKILPASQLS